MRKNFNYNNNSSSQNFSSMMNSEKNLLNELVVKSKFERKAVEYSIKNFSSGCIEMLNIGFNIFIKNMLNNLENVAAVEKNSENLGGFLKNSANIV